jgi:hypothetical protein
MAGKKGLTGEQAAQYADRSAKGNTFKPLPGVASPRAVPNAAHRKLKSGIQKALKDAGLAKGVHLAFRYYKNLDVAGAGCGCGCGTAKKKKKRS